MIRTTAWIVIPLALAIVIIGSFFLSTSYYSEVVCPVRQQFGFDCRAQVAQAVTSSQPLDTILGTINSNIGELVLYKHPVIQDIIAELHALQSEQVALNDTNISAATTRYTPAVSSHIQVGRVLGDSTSYSYPVTHFGTKTFLLPIHVGSDGNATLTELNCSEYGGGGS